jgi:hypothetical protein
MIAPATPRRRGRPAAWSLSPEEAEALRGLVLMRSTDNREHFSVAMEEFLHHPACLPGTADKIRAELLAAQAECRRPNWPLSLRRLGKPGKNEAAMFRGPKHMANCAPSIRRGGFWVDENGRERALLPFDIYESDDISINEPFKWQDALSGLWMAGRQTLASIDVGSGGWLGATCVARPRDAYRQEDIADHFLDVCRLHGMPRVWRLERGSWAATFVSGIEMEGMASRWGALDGLFRVVHTEHARGKGLIEGRFDLLQVFMAHTEGGLTMGRHADDFERVSRLMRRVGYDRRRAEDDLPTDQAAVKRLWNVAEASEGTRRAMERCNSRPMERHWASDLTLPAALLASRHGREIPENELWRFYGAKVATAVQNDGGLSITLPNYEQPFRFALNGAGGLYLPPKYQLFAAFSPQRPEEGCVIGNRDRSVRNRESWGMGEIIPLRCPYLADAPQVDLTTASGASGPGLRKGFAQATRTEFRGVRTGMRTYVAARKEQIAAEETIQPVKAARSEVRDGLGGRTEVSRGMASRADRQPVPKPNLTAFRGRSLGGAEEALQIRVRRPCLPNPSSADETFENTANCPGASFRDRARTLLGETA